MNDFLIYFLVIITIMMVVNKKLENKDIEKVKSTIDNRIYLVRKLPDSNKAANKLAEINQSVLKLIDNLDKEKEGTDRLIKRYNPDNLSETEPGAKYTSYSVNKGEQISICLRKSDESGFEENNIVMFVVIHELAHVMTKTIGHDETFWKNMKYLLEEAEKIGLYIPVDYSIHNVDYCGMEVKSTPYDFKK